MKVHFNCRYQTQRLLDRCLLNAKVAYTYETSRKEIQFVQFQFFHRKR